MFQCYISVLNILSNYLIFTGAYFKYLYKCSSTHKLPMVQWSVDEEGTIGRRVCHLVIINFTIIYHNHHHHHCKVPCHSPPSWLSFTERKSWRLEITRADTRPSGKTVSACWWTWEFGGWWTSWWSSHRFLPKRKTSPPECHRKRNYSHAKISWEWTK